MFRKITKDCGVEIKWFSEICFYISMVLAGIDVLAALIGGIVCCAKLGFLIGCAAFFGGLVLAVIQFIIGYVISLFSYSFGEAVDCLDDIRNSVTSHFPTSESNYPADYSDQEVDENEKNYPIYGIVPEEEYEETKYIQQDEFDAAFIKDVKKCKNEELLNMLGHGEAFYTGPEIQIIKAEANARGLI